MRKTVGKSVSEVQVNGTADRAKLLIDSNDNPYTSWKDVGEGESTESGKKDRKQSKEIL